MYVYLTLTKDGDDKAPEPRHHSGYQPGYQPSLLLVVLVAFCYDTIITYFHVKWLNVLLVHCLMYVGIYPCIRKEESMWFWVMWWWCMIHALISWCIPCLLAINVSCPLLSSYLFLVATRPLHAPLPSPSPSFDASHVKVACFVPLVLFSSCSATQLHCNPRRWHGYVPFIDHSSLLTPHSSFLIPHSSFLIPHSSFLIPHSSFLIPHSSFLIPHSSFLIHHSPFTIHHSPFIIYHTTTRIYDV